MKDTVLFSWHCEWESDWGVIDQRWYSSIQFSLRFSFNPDMTTNDICFVTLCHTNKNQLVRLPNHAVHTIIKTTLYLNEIWQYYLLRKLKKGRDTQKSSSFILFLFPWPFLFLCYFVLFLNVSPKSMSWVWHLNFRNLVRANPCSVKLHLHRYEWIILLTL